MNCTPMQSTAVHRRYEMSSDKVIAAIKEQVRLDAWQREMEERQSSGLSVKAWCKERGLSLSAYYHRLRKLREAVGEQVGEQECKDRSVLSCPVPTPAPVTAVVPIRRADTPLVGSSSGLSGDCADSSSDCSSGSSSVGSSSGIEIECGGLRIKVSGECPAELVCAMLRELKA